MDREAQQQQRRVRRNRRRAVSLGTLAVVVVVIVVVVTAGGSSKSSTSTTTSSTSAAGRASAAAVKVSTGPVSLEAGVLPWQLPAAVSRSGVVPNGSGFTVLGGLASSQSSVAAVYSVDPATGAATPGGTLPTAVHDAAAASFGTSTYVLGGGSPDTVATIAAVPTPAAPPAAAGPGTTTTGSVVGKLPTPRSDLAVATIGSGKSATAYVVGGYDGTTYQPAVLATTDGTRFTTVGQLTVPVRYAAVVTQGGRIYAFGGQTASPGVAAAATDAIQVIDPATGRSKVVGHLPQALYGAAAFVVDGTMYVAGGQVPNGPTLTTIDAFEPATGKVLNAGLLPQAEAFGGYTTVGTGKAAVGYIVGGEVAAQSGPDQAGVASGTLQSVQSLRPSPYGGPAGVPVPAPRTPGRS